MIACCSASCRRFSCRCTSLRWFSHLRAVLHSAIVFSRFVLFLINPIKSLLFFFQKTYQDISWFHKFQSKVFPCSKGWKIRPQGWIKFYRHRNPCWIELLASGILGTILSDRNKSRVKEKKLFDLCSFFLFQGIDVECRWFWTVFRYSTRWRVWPLRERSDIMVWKIFLYKYHLCFGSKWRYFSVWYLYGSGNFTTARKLVVWNLCAQKLYGITSFCFWCDKN